MGVVLNFCWWDDFLVGVNEVGESLGLGFKECLYLGGGERRSYRFRRN